MEDKSKDGIAAALGRIPQGMYILTARFEDRRTGMLVSWVQQVSFRPPMVAVAVAKGRAIMPLISDSRHFGLCQIQKGDRTMLRKFASGFNTGEDPFLGLELLPQTLAHLPILASSLAFMECEVTTHVDVEGDHDVFVGTIRRGGAIPGEPQVHLRENGFKY